ncbi:MAG: hypothetical protein ACXAC7_14375, partial [Candidatus Hodarchaeales archaeon]
GIQVDYDYVYLSSDPTNETNTYTSTIWGSNLYVYVICDTIYDMTPDNRQVVEIRTKITEVEPGVSGGDETTITVTPSTPGETTLDAGFYDFVTINMGSLPTKTWVRIVIDFLDVSLSSSEVALLQYPTINTYQYFYLFNDLTVRSSGSHYFMTLGFGSMNSTATLTLLASTTVEGTLSVSLSPQPTQTLGFNYPLLGKPAPKASTAPEIKGAEAPAGGISGFLFLSTMGVVALVALRTIYKRRRN